MHPECDKAAKSLVRVKFDVQLVPHKYFFSAEINLDNYEEAFRTMKRAILANE